ncbi:MAG: MATE family efflux transporter [Oscillospiraceae bacterium]|nr:MATE family efflux transporter [Oscillospiraceae bacterium]
MKKDMTKGKEWRVILLFTLPILAGFLLQQTYNIVDGILVGNLIGELALGAVGTTQSMVFLFLGVSSGLSVGVGVVISQYFGAGKESSLPSAIDTALILLGFFGLLTSMTAFVVTPFLLREILGVPEEKISLSITYFRIYSIGLFFQFVYNAVAAILRSVGDSKATLYFLLISTILSAILTPLFIVVIPWGVAGAAFSTLIAKAMCAVVSYIYMRKRFPFVKSGVHWDAKIALTMTKLGLPVAIQISFVSIGYGAMQRLVNGFERTVPGVMAAYTAAARLDMILAVPLMAFQSGLASFVGQNIGAEQLDRVKRGFRVTLAMALGVVAVVSVLFYIFAGTLLSVFGLEVNSLPIGVSIVRFMSVWVWIFAVQMTVSGVLQGAGDTVVQSAATLIALAIRVSTGYLAVYLGVLGYSAAWMTTPLGWGVVSLILCARYFTGKWKTKAVAKKSEV